MRNYIAYFLFACMAAGFILTLGTVGACETEMISLSVFLRRSAVYMSLMLFGFFGLEVVSR